MKSVNEQFAEMQKKTLENLEPMQSMNTLAAEAFERIARKNYDLMGDLVDYAVAQVKVPNSNANLQEVYEQRVAETKAFAEKVNERAAEYVALAGELGEMTQAKTTSAVEAAQAATTSAVEAATAATSSAVEAAQAATTSAVEAATAATSSAVEAATAATEASAEKAPATKKKAAAKKTAAKAK